MPLHNANALAVARALESSAKVARVWYAGLASHPDHALASALLRGFGGVVTFELAAGDYAAAERFCDACRVFQIAASLGGVESLLHPPALFSYWDLPEDVRVARGIPDGMVRLAVGIEDEGELLEDVARGLAAV
jgi:cystathionine gamma-synthase